MKFVWNFPGVKFNPFVMANHNGVTLPRIVHHSLHVALGLIVSLLCWVFHWPLVIMLVLGTILAVYDKFTWMDMVTEKFHPWIVPPEIECYDFISDLGLTLLGATISFWGWWVIPTYYVLSLVNDP